MTSLLDVHRFLAAGLRADPLLCLAQAVVCFDPFWNETDDDDEVALALDVVRRAFPAVYALAVNALHHGATVDDLDCLICAEISALGFPIDNLEVMVWGIPLPAYGATLHDPDFFTQHPAIVPVVRMFGIQLRDEYPVDVPDHAYTAAHRITESLIEHPDERYQQVGWLLGWLFSCTGNSCIDLDYDTMAEYQPLAWEPDHVDFATAIMQEADEIFTAAQAGLALVQSDPHITQALQDNIQRLCRFFAQQPQETEDHDPPRLCWPALDGGTARTTESDA